MFLHCVFCNFRENIFPKSRAYIFQELSLLSQRLDGVLSFDFGPNLDFEGKSQGYSDGFIIRFKDQYALEAYAQNPTHQNWASSYVDFAMALQMVLPSLIFAHLSVVGYHNYH